MNKPNISKILLIAAVFTAPGFLGNGFAVVVPEAGTTMSFLVPALLGIAAFAKRFGK